MTLSLHSRSPVHLKLDKCLLCSVIVISGTVFRLLHSNLPWRLTYARHTCPCSCRWSWPWCKVTVGQQRWKNQRWIVRTAKQRSITLATTVGLFLCDLDGTLKTFIWFDHLVFLSELLEWIDGVDCIQWDLKTNSFCNEMLLKTKLWITIPTVFPCILPPLRGVQLGRSNFDGPWQCSLQGCCTATVGGKWHCVIVQSSLSSLGVGGGRGRWVCCPVELDESMHLFLVIFFNSFVVVCDFFTRWHGWKLFSIETEICFFGTAEC